MSLKLYSEFVQITEKSDTLKNLYRIHSIKILFQRGIVEFDRKNSATKAIEQVNQGCFFLTLSPRAVVCSAVDSVDDADGLQEECLYNTYGFEEEYSYPPRFAAPETFEMDFGNRWKALEELERSQIEQVKLESAERKQRLEQEMRVGIGEEQVND